jgi:hypothetical protein
MKMYYLCFHKNLTGLLILTETFATLFFVQVKFSLTAHWRLQGTLLYILGERGPGFLIL